MDSADVHVAPGGGALVDLGGLGVHFKVRGEQTGGSFAIVEHPLQPGVLVDPHIHRNEDELSYVLEGTIWARVGDREVEAVTGSYVWKPRGVLHTFWNPGPEPARILEVIRLLASSACSTGWLRCWSTRRKRARRKCMSSADSMASASIALGFLI